MPPPPQVKYHFLYYVISKLYIFFLLFCICITSHMFDTLNLHRSVKRNNSENLIINVHVFKIIISAWVCVWGGGGESHAITEGSAKFPKDECLYIHLDYTWKLKKVNFYINVSISLTFLMYTTIVQFYYQYYICISRKITL